eukprot:g2690.t1
MMKQSVSEMWKDSGVGVPEDVRKAMVDGGTKNVDRVTDFAVDQARTSLENSRSSSAADEASSRLDAVVAQTLDTNEEAERRIREELLSLEKSSQADAEKKNAAEDDRATKALDELNSFGTQLREEISRFKTERRSLRASRRKNEESAHAANEKDRELFGGGLAKEFARWDQDDDELGKKTRSLERSVEDSKEVVSLAEKEREEHESELARHGTELEVMRTS